MRLAVFDCDGTLADSQHAIIAAMREAFAALVRAAPDDAAIRRITGLSVEAALARLAPTLGQAERDRLADHYRAAFRAGREAAGAAPEPLFPGIVPLLDALAADGWTLAVATGKSTRGLDRLLAAHGIADRFAVTATADDHPSKPDPAMLTAVLAATGAAPADAVMIGDTSFDMTMARAAGVRAIGVGWGYHAPAELRQAGAAAVADDSAMLADFLGVAP